MSDETPSLNIHPPPHLVANELIRAGVKFGEQGHAMLAELVNLYNREVERFYDMAAGMEAINEHHHRAIETTYQLVQHLWRQGKMDADTCNKLMAALKPEGREQP